MAYYFTIKDKNGYKCINLSNHPFFERLSKYKGNKYSLEEIDIFTSNYANMLSLKEALLFDGILDEKEVTKELSVRIKSKNGLIKVMYEPVFKESSKYLGIDYLTYQMKILACDYDFLIKLLNHYRNSSVNNETLAGIREYTFGNPEVNINELIDQFISREIYNFKYDQEQKKYIVTSIKYKSLHDLAMFVYNYLNKPVLSKEEINEELKSFISYLKGEDIKKEEITIPKTKKVKKRIKGNNEGQTSFLD